MEDAFEDLTPVHDAKPKAREIMEALDLTVQTIVADAVASVPVDTTATLERDFESVIVAAADGNAAALTLLKPALFRIAQAHTTYVGDAKRVASQVGRALGNKRGGFGKPAPGDAAGWLTRVTNYIARSESERRARERWADGVGDEGGEAGREGDGEGGGDARFFARPSRGSLQLERQTC